MRIKIIQGNSDSYYQLLAYYADFQRGFDNHLSIDGAISLGHPPIQPSNDWTLQVSDQGLNIDSIGGRIPSNFSKIWGEGETDTIFLCDPSLVPDRVPDRSLFLTTDNATVNDYIQVFLLYDEEFKDRNINYVVLCLGTNDLKKEVKEQIFDEKNRLLI